MGTDHQPSVDAVFTWVDGNDPAWRTTLHNYVQKNPQYALDVNLASYRYRDSGELRFSLRSLEAHAPWINRVFIVTQGQVPDWLDIGQEGITIIRHDEIFPNPGDLPTFNSHAIELCLHRIPGLSERFLYFNDDQFLARQAVRSDFLDSKGEIIFFDRIHLDRHLDPQSPMDRACLRTRRRVEDYSRVSLEWLPAHVPRFFRRSILADMELAFAEDFSATRASPFRDSDDFVIRMGYAALLKARGHTSRLLKNDTEHYQFMRMQPGLYRRFRDFQEIKRRKPRFLCINDELNDTASCRMVRALLIRCLTRLFPIPSRFERHTAPGSN